VDAVAVGGAIPGRCESVGTVPHRTVTDPERLHALIDAMLLIGVEAPLSELLQRIVDVAADLVGARYAALGVLDEDVAALQAFVTHGVSDAERAAIGSAPRGRGVLGQVIVERRPIRFDDLTSAPAFAGFPPHHPPMRQFLGVPVWVRDDDVFGNLYLCDRLDGAPFSDEDEAVLEALGRAAGFVIAEAKVKDRLREVTLGDERTRLARDLHDSVIQRLFAVGLSLQSVAGSALPDEAHARILWAIDELDTTIREIRATIFELTSESGRAGTSLRRQLLELVDEVTTRLGLPVSVAFAGPVDTAIGPSLAAHILHAVRELLSNVVRHASASQAHLRLEVADGTATVTVADDGVGPGRSTTGGHGLSNLEERARAVGGTCVVAHHEGGGTIVRWTATWLG
jgi:two-component system, NarL family, sensor histidine kinase DevS